MGRMRGFFWLITGLMVALLAGFVAFATLRAAQNNVATTGQVTAAVTVPVVVAASDVPVRSLLTAVELTVREMPVEAAPPGYLSDIDRVAGRVTLVDLYAGEAVLPQRLVEPDAVAADGRTALLLSEGQVLFAFPTQDLMSQTGVLKPGDRVDILFSLVNVPTTLDPAADVIETPDGVILDENDDEKQVTLTLLQNVTISAIVGGTTTTAEGGASPAGVPALLLTVDPQDALVLKYAKDAGGIVDIVLRAPEDSEEFDTEPVDMEYMINRYEIPLD